MTQQALSNSGSNGKGDIVELTDKTLCCIMIALKTKYTFYKGAGKTIFEFDKHEAEPILYKWKHHEPIPIQDVREVFSAITSFNSAVRD